jgi:hypothetical protein
VTRFQDIVWDVSEETEHYRKVEIPAHRAADAERKMRRGFWSGVILTVAAWGFVGACLWVAFR